MVRLRLAFLGLLASLAMVACSGGGTSAPSAPLATALPNAGGNAKIFVPSGRPASSRGARFVAASVVSVATSTNGGPAVITDVSATSAACTSVAGGRSCTVPLSALPGLATFTFSLYDAAAGGGKLLGSGTATFTVVAGTPFVVPVTLNGVVASVTVSLPTAFNVGAAATLPVIVIAKDPDGNTIIAPGNYTTPITLANSDSTGIFKLSSTTVNGPSDVITLTYTGAPTSTPITITPAATGLTGAALVAATVSPTNFIPSSASYTENSTDTFLYSSFNTPTPVGSSTPAPAPTPTTFTTVIRHVVAPGATFNAIQGALDDKQTYTYGITNPTTGTTPQTYTYDRYYKLVPTAAGANLNYIGDQFVYSDTYGTNSYTTMTNATFLSLPLVDGATITVDPTSTSTTQFSPAPSPSPTATGTTATAYFYNASQTVDAASNRSYSSNSSYSSENRKDNADGSGSLTVTYASPKPQSGASVTSIVANITPPSGGSVNLTITQNFTTGPASTTALTIPTTSIYPNGIPTLPQSLSTTVLAKNVALPAECPIPAVLVSPPFVAIKFTSTYWSPIRASTNFATFTDYYASGLGIVCEVGDAKSSDFLRPTTSSSPPTIQNLTSYASTSTDHSVTYLTALGVASSNRSPASIAFGIPRFASGIALGRRAFTGGRPSPTTMLSEIAR